MTVTREVLDRIVNEHFGYEATDDVAGVMVSLTEDAEREVIPSPVGALSDRAKIPAYYDSILRDLKGEGIRLQSAGFPLSPAPSDTGRYPTTGPHTVPAFSLGSCNLRSQLTVCVSCERRLRGAARRCRSLSGSAS
jgi:hypothetical protein